MSYEVQGVVEYVGDTKQFSEKFRKRELRINYDNGKFDCPLVIEFANDYSDKLDGIGAGDMVRCSFDLSGRKWDPPNGGDAKYFMSLRGFRVENLSKAEAGAMTETAPPPISDDIPF